MKYLFLSFCLLLGLESTAQGPPITGDKAIMLAQGNMLLKTLTEIRKIPNGHLAHVPLIVHYLPKSNFLVGIHVPMVNRSYESSEKSAFGLGDIQLLTKYQFYRKDQMGKTFRIAAKNLQLLPTGKELDFPGISTGRYSTYTGVIAGLETIKYGITSELGYLLSPKDDHDELRYKLGFGLPLKKPTYPVDQFNLYFEYQSSWFVSDNTYELLYSQGFQYAKNQNTFEIAIQFPLTQSKFFSNERLYSLYLGTRYVF